MNVIKTGTVIHDIKDDPLFVEPLLKPKTARYRKINAMLKYAGKGKAYVSAGEIKYAINRNGIYVLEMPLSFRVNKDGSLVQSSREHIGYKFGQTSSLGGLISRFGTYYVEVGTNVKILHIRIFNNENLSYFGSRERAKDYELAIKQTLARRKIKPMRGAGSAEYYKTLKDILDAMDYVDKNPDLIGDIAEIEIKKVGNELATGDRLVLLMSEDGKLVPYKLTLKQFVKKDNKWKVKFDDDDKRDWRFAFPESLRGVSNRSSGWVMLKDAKLGIWKRAK